MKKIIFLTVCVLFLSRIAYPCDVTNSSGSESVQGSLLHIIMNQLGGCSEIHINTPQVDPLNFAPYIYSNVKIYGNGQTLSLKSGATNDCVVNIRSSQSSKTGVGNSLLQNVKINGSGSRNGVCIYSDGNTLNNVEVSNSLNGALVQGNKNKIPAGNKFHDNTVGVKVDGGDQNLISQSLFYGNGTLGIDLVNGGNSDILFPFTPLAVVKKDLSAVVGITGLLDPDTTKLELFKSDTETVSLAQGQGKVFNSTITPILQSWNVSGRNRFAAAINISLNTGYTLTAFDTIVNGIGNTSEFSATFNPANDDEKVIGDTPCLTDTADWFLKALDGLNVSGNSIAGNPPWDIDSDGDGLSNVTEDKNQNCKVDAGETDPSKPDEQPPQPEQPLDCDTVEELCDMSSVTDPFGAVICLTINAIFEISCDYLSKCTAEHPTWPDTKKDELIIADKCSEELDIDGDEIPYSEDNCPLTYNPGQEDFDKDGVGGACEGDRDKDGIPDGADNCIDIPNVEQLNTDGDPLGDVCDLDDDNDGLTDDAESEAGTESTNPDGDGDGFCDGPNFGFGKGKTACVPMDNCPKAANFDQKDSDNDGIGDACDLAPNDACASVDSDSDSIYDFRDNCPRVANYGQKDGDGDDSGDPCDFYDNVNNVDYATIYTRSLDIDDWDGDDVNNVDDSDADGDGITDKNETCSDEWNPDQRDTDHDKIPDACDDNDDDDDLTDPAESANFLLKWWDYYHPDMQGKTLKLPIKICIDSDKDGIPDGDDNCPGSTSKEVKKCELNFGPEKGAPQDANFCWNVKQTDVDKDGAGDVCDNCVELGNVDQADMDADGLGDLCDDDMDGDGMPNQFDNCPTIYNPKQEDKDADGIGDVCELPSFNVAPAEALPVPATINDIHGGGTSYSSTAGCSNLSNSGAAGNLPLAILLFAPIFIISSLRSKKI